MKTVVCLSVLFLAGMTLRAADITGKWSGFFSRTGPNGEAQQETTFLILQQKGTEVTGSGGPEEVRQYPIQNGKIEGDRITFEVLGEGPLYKLDLVLEGDHIKGDVTVVVLGGETVKAKVDITRVQSSKDGL